MITTCRKGHCWAPSLDNGWCNRHNAERIDELEKENAELRKLAQELLATNGRGYSVMVDAEKYDALNAYLEVTNEL